MTEEKVSVHWFRRDLRLEDNAALYHALHSGRKVVCVFIFDRSILDKLDDSRDARVLFIHREILRLKKELNQLGSDLWVLHGTAREAWESITGELSVGEVFANRDYEPYALERDKAIFEFLGQKGIRFRGFKNHVVFDRSEVMKDDGTPYMVFTPYSKRWKALLNDFYLRAYPTEAYFGALAQQVCMEEVPSLEAMGFEDFQFDFPPRELDERILARYADLRDIPSADGTSRLSLHLRFGTVSIRALVRAAAPKSEKWLNELIWRDFYQMILFHFPHSATDAFRPVYDRIPWLNDESQFEAWCEGRTGFPLVDAGMRELNTTGFMHNRVRMVVASFLTKHLLIDWRWGERYFAKKLLDFDLASNVGGWQWAAGCGVDAAPYFRVFNPSEQLRKFDAEIKYVKKWVPEFGTTAYPQPIVDHNMARNRAIATYQSVLK